MHKADIDKQAITELSQQQKVLIKDNPASMPRLSFAKDDLVVPPKHVSLAEKTSNGQQDQENSISNILKGFTNVVNNVTLIMAGKNVDDKPKRLHKDLNYVNNTSVASLIDDGKLQSIEELNLPSLGAFGVINSIEKKLLSNDKFKEKITSILNKKDNFMYSKLFSDIPKDYDEAFDIFKTFLINHSETINYDNDTNGKIEIYNLITSNMSKPDNVDFDKVIKTLKDFDERELGNYSLSNNILNLCNQSINLVTECAMLNEENLSKDRHNKCEEIRNNIQSILDTLRSFAEQRCQQILRELNDNNEIVNINLSNIFTLLPKNKNTEDSKSVLNIVNILDNIYCSVVDKANKKVKLNDYLEDIISLMFVTTLIDISCR